MSDDKRLTRYADKAMFEAEPMEKEQLPSVSLVSATLDPLGAIAAACRMYEGKATRSMDDVTDDERRHYWEQVQKTHLKAPLEFVDLHFFIEGVTRAFTHQMVRQRTAVYAQESLRFAVKEEIAARPGPNVKLSGQQEVWDAAVDSVWTAYKHLIANGVPAEDARGLLPHDTLTRLNYKTNLRNLLDHAGNRLCTQAQFEWRLVFNEIIRSMRATDDLRYRWQWELITTTDVFKPVCYQLGHCPFTADFDRGCTIRERVEAGRFDEINDVEWALDPKAGWVR